MKEQVFFGEKGLTSTSANHLANMAKEFVKREEIELSNMSFIDETVQIIGSNATHQLKMGITSLECIPAKLDKIAKATSLIAWLREAIKAKTQLQKTLSNLSIADFCAIQEIELPVAPKEDHILTETEYYNNLPINTRNRYFQLETICATIGKYIHPDGAFASQRDNLMRVIMNPTKVSGNGKDTLIYMYSPSVTTEEVNRVFYDLQDSHREAQKALNAIKFECEKAIMESQAEVNAKYRAELEVYEEAMTSIRAQFRKYITEQNKVISNLKIVIPDSLSDIYETINNLGK